MYDILVIGCGVSGLTFASKLNNNFKICIYEYGKHHDQRDHEDSIDSMIGSGGAGLYSDGKFSFYPAGTKVWNIDNITKAENYLNRDIKQYCDIDKFTKNVDETQSYLKWSLKQYPSIYLSLEQRKDLINKLFNQIKTKDIYFEHSVLSFEKIDDYYLVAVKDLKKDKILYVKTKTIIISGGRFCGLYLKNLPTIFRRFEYGVRIVANANNAVMTHSNLIDPKYIITFNEYQNRTFCWCQNGSVVLTDNMNGIKTYSGRSDCEPTGKSNFGLNVRIVDESEFDQKSMLNISKIKPFKYSFNNINKTEIIDNYGVKYGELLLKSINNLTELFGELPEDDVEIVGPTLEGIGYYPNIDEKTLKIKDNDIYCIGDATGIFRGIIASMLSGYALAETFNKMK